MRAMIAGISRGYSQAVNNRCSASDPTPRNNRALSSTQTHGCFLLVDETDVFNHHTGSTSLLFKPAQMSIVFYLTPMVKHPVIPQYREP
jgi:hypothetical protein